ncbi:uncharacterized protein A4U43_C05F27040 [Asparagus officinalis]|uniref:non-specific serine/threonine protein kinase n=1 Tax=Asparagus officinalis TaxID=4686 RepID=A0A5P1EUY7_ASPOF|nr:probable LRR receptor-like serine/threonine-protein kinase At3g47570 [Asparagus officinalis]ONK69816.1 uncharacterized protein A4U43_C05F27040 [Asparagus officinalis]
MKKNPTLLLLLLLLLLENSLQSSSSPSSTDLNALLAIKNSITSDPLDAVTSSWAPPTSFCNWTGVSCDAQNQRVVSLNLSQLSLRGKISPLISNLTLLQSLDLSTNSFAGVVPDSIALLPNLRHLNLSVNQLTGPIPAQLFNSSSLQKVVLATNQLYGEIEDDLNLPRVDLLSISWNQIGGRIPKSLRRCRRLQTLSLSYNEFVGGVPDEIGSLKDLEGLYLGYNNLTGVIPNSLGNLTKLLELTLNHMGLVGRIPDEFARFGRLRLLNLGENGLTGGIDSIYNMTSLEKLGLSFNHLYGSLPDDLGFRLPNLQGIYLSGNRFSGEIPASLSNASMLSVIEFSDNFFTGSVPDALGDLEILQSLSLQGNNLKGGLKFLDPITKCRSLENLLIGENEFGGRLPESIGNLSRNILRFRAPNCKLEGKIPDSIGNLISLIYLNLHDNQLSGELPRTISGLKNLQMTYLYSNRLQGRIPIELCSLRALSYISIYNNALSGPIPDCIGNISGLQRLYLSDNSLSSTIPSSIWSLQRLIALNLSQNSLVGSLSSNVSNLASLTELDLAMNQLTGAIPSTIGDLEMLRFLILSQNSFSGPIPQSFGRLGNMEGMDISSNLLTGTIPKSFSNLSYFTFLNVSFNKLEGQVPKGGVFSNMTAESFMGNEALCGNLQLGLPTCKLEAVIITNAKSRTHLLKYILPPVSLTIVLAAIFFYFLYKKPKIVLSTDGNSTAIDHRMISRHELIRATENFSESNLLGVGIHGSVYKGKLDDNMIAAIKVLNLQTEGALKSFDAECEVMRKVRHRNLVKIISTCSNLDFKALVLQFMPNGSLEVWLHSGDCYLSLAQRVNIMLDVALALEYLHHEHSEVVVHCDLKPSNVLLDEEMTAHVADFGIAKLLADDNKSIMQSNAPGTLGYMAPEYGATGRVSPKADVYSYGILLIETFSGKRPTDEMFADVLSLRKWVSDALPHSVLQAVDSNLLEREVLCVQEEKYTNIKSRCLSSIIDLGLQCSRESPRERMSMKYVTSRLRKIKSELNV